MIGRYAQNYAGIKIIREISYEMCVLFVLLYG